VTGEVADSLSWPQVIAAQDGEVIIRIRRVNDNPEASVLSVLEEQKTKCLSASSGLRKLLVQRPTLTKS
jgi:hypothetical protein